MPVRKDKFAEAIMNSPDREAVRRLPGSVLWVSIDTSKTPNQHAAFWRDVTVVARLLDCKKEVVYEFIKTHPKLADIFVVRERLGNRHIVMYRGMSELTKDEMSELFPRMRDILQAEVDASYGEPVRIDWSCADKEEKGWYWQEIEKEE